MPALRLILCVLFFSASLSAQEYPASSTNSLTGRAAALFAAGDREGACRHAMQAALENPSDEKALGIAKLTCSKAQANLKFQGLKVERHQIEPEKTAPQPEAGPGISPEAGKVVIPAVAPGRIVVEATSYDKTREAQDAVNRGRFSEAVAAAEAAIALEPGNIQAYVLAAEAHRLLGRPRQSLEVALAGLGARPQNLALLKNKAAALIALEDFSAALEAAEAALKVNATDPLAHALRAYALGRAGERVGMIGALRTAAALDPSYEKLFIEAQNSKEGSVTPFTLPGQALASGHEVSAKRKAPQSRFKSKILFMGLLLVLIVIIVLLTQSVVAYWTSRRDDGQINP